MSAAAERFLTTANDEGDGWAYSLHRCGRQAGGSLAPQTHPGRDRRLRRFVEPFELPYYPDFEPEVASVYGRPPGALRPRGVRAGPGIVAATEQWSSIAASLSPGSGPRERDVHRARLDEPGAVAVTVSLGPLPRAQTGGDGTPLLHRGNDAGTGPNAARLSAPGGRP